MSTRLPIPALPIRYRHHLSSPTPQHYLLVIFCCIRANLARTFRSAHYKPSREPAPSTWAVSSCPNSIRKNLPFTSPTQHGPITTKSSPMSASPSPITPTSPRRPRALTSMACCKPCGQPRMARSSSCTPAPTTQPASTPRRTSGARSPP